MKFEQAHEVLEGVPHILTDNARKLYDFVLEGGVRDIIELGLAHGTSACYMAAALDERGVGRIVSLDLDEAKQRQPNMDEVAGKLGLRKYIEPMYGQTSYTWDLLKLVRQNTVDGVCRPVFDFAFIDGSHAWESDGLAFFLIDKLLKPGGWMLFDDLSWKFTLDRSQLMIPMIANLPQDVLDTPHVAMIFEYLVSQHPDYTDQRVEGEWGWARKRPDAADPKGVEPALLARIYETSIAADAARVGRRVVNRLKVGIKR